MNKKLTGTLMCDFDRDMFYVHGEDFVIDLKHGQVIEYFNDVMDAWVKLKISSLSIVACCVPGAWVLTDIGSFNIYNANSFIGSLVRVER